MKLIFFIFFTEESLIATYRQVGQQLDQKRLIVDKLTAELNASKTQEEVINDQIKGDRVESISFENISLL